VYDSGVGEGAGVCAYGVWEEVGVSVGSCC